MLVWPGCLDPDASAGRRKHQRAPRDPPTQPSPGTRTICRADERRRLDAGENGRRLLTGAAKERCSMCRESGCSLPTGIDRPTQSNPLTPTPEPLASTLSLSELHHTTQFCARERPLTSAARKA